MDEVAENSDELMERYLEGEEISHEEIVTALKQGVTQGHLFPVTCGVATKNLGTNRLLEALVEDVPSPAMRGAVKALDAEGNETEIEPSEDGDPVAYVFKTTADPYTGRINMLRVYSGVLRSDSQAFNVTRKAKERIGQLVGAAAARRPRTIDELGPGDIGAVAKLRETRAGDVLAAKDAADLVPAARPAGAGDGVRLRAEVEGRRGEGGDARFAGSRRRTRRSTSTATRRPGEQIIAGLTQIHVEVIVERMKRRYGAEIELHPPQVPYLETIRKPAKAHGRYKKQTGGRGQFGDCHIEIEPAESGSRVRVRERDQGRGDPDRLHPGGREGDRGGDAAGGARRAIRSRTSGSRLYDGQHHSVDSSEMAFKIAGSMAFKQAVGRSRALPAGADRADDDRRSPRTRSATWSATSTRGAGARSASSRRAR